MIRARQTDDVERVIDRVAAHVAAEVTSDPAAIAATISGQPFFPVLVRSVDGLDLVMLTEPDTVAEFYRARVDTFEIVDSNRVAEFRTDWYALHESLATVRHVGEFNGVPPSRQEFRVHSVVLFPTAPDGIVGELEWTRFDFADIFRASAAITAVPPGPESHLPVARLTAADRHERLIRAWWAGDADGVLAELADDVRWASKHDHDGQFGGVVHSASDRAGVERIVAAFTEIRSVELTRLQRYATEWFSFAEWKIAVHSDEPRTLRLATLAPVGRRGELLGQLAYVVDATT